MANFLELRNVFHDFEEISFREYKEQVQFGGEDIEENNREAVYVNKEHKQSIIFHEYRYKGEEKLKDISTMPNYISESAYDYICKILNSTDNVTVLWSQIYGTTSDYTIIYNNYLTNEEECLNHIENFNGCGSYKYVEVVEGVCYKCEC